MLSKKFLLPLIFTIFQLNVFAQKNLTLSGYITDSGSGEGLIGATIYSASTSRGAITNAYGFYSITLPVDTGTIVFSFIGYIPQEVKFTKTTADSPLNIKLIENSNQLSEIEIVGYTDEKDVLKSTDGNIVSVSMKQVKLLPSVLGESDLIKAVQMMPGVITGGELNSNFFVRGGEADQNLVILDEAVVYNTGHLIGFYSIFNSDAIKDVKLYKGGFPANYGGRLSSVLDVRMKDGNINEFHGVGNIGVLSSKFTFEGPIVKEKLSFIASARRTYIDKVYGMFGVIIPYYFYDLNVKLNWKISEKDRLYVSSYFGNDVLYMPDKLFEEDTSVVYIDSTGAISNPKFGFTLGNKTFTLRWNHQFNSKLFSNTSLIYNNFKYDLEAEDGTNLLLISSRLEGYSLKSDFDYNLNSKNQISFGTLFTQNYFSPNLIFTEGEISEFINEQTALKLQTFEACGYLLDEIEIFKKFKINFGLRYTKVFNGDTKYDGLEPRFFANWMINNKNSFKFGYSQMKQYLHRVSSSNFILPTDMYYPVTNLVKPQEADQFFMSYTRNYPDKNIVLTIEAYTKTMSNLIEFKEGTKLLLNNDFEKDLLSGTGESSGFEVFLQKTEGDVTGWISYAYAVSNRYFEDLNNGNPFPSKNDRRHNISVIGIFKITEKLDLSVSWIYMTGARFTSIVGQYVMPNPAQTGYEIIPIYSDRNSIEMSENKRLDVNLSYKPHIGKNHKFKTEWQFGVYNVFNEAAPYRIDLVYDERGFYEYKQPGLFGTIFNLSFNFFF